jgi:hypothetical protein
MAKSKPLPTSIDGQPIEPVWTPRQRAFINSDARFPLMYGGVGAGKTAALCRRALRFSVCYPGNQGLLCRYTLGESNDTLLKTWRKFIPEPLYTMRADRWGWIITVATADRQHPSSILVRALDEEQKYQSLELGWFGISQANEQWITRDLWDTLTSRLRWTLPDGSHPPFTGFAEANSGSPWIIALWGPERDHAMTGYEAIEVSMYDNAANLPADYMQSLEEKPSWWKRWWLEACWEPLAELEGEPVFEGYFKHELHVATDPLTPESGWPIVRGWDLPGRVACTFFQITRKGRILVLYEHLADISDSIETTKHRVLEVSAILFPKASFLDLGDPAAFTKAPTDQRAPADLLRPEILLQRGETTLSTRLAAVQTGLKTLVDGKPALQLDPRCRILINGFTGGYVWKMVAGRVLPEPQKNSYSHLMDSFSHALARVSGQLDPKTRREMAGPRGALIPVP